MGFEKVEFGKREITDLSLFESLTSAGQTGMAVFNGPALVSHSQHGAIGTNTDEKRMAFDRLLAVFTRTAKEELRDRIENLVDQKEVAKYSNIVSGALQSVVESLQEIQLEKSEVPRFDAVLKKFGDTLHAAEVAVQRPKLNMAKTKEIVADLRRRLEL